MVNEREKTVLEDYQEDGWTGLHNGAPDWLFVKTEDGDIVDVKFVEVKGPAGRVRYEQEIWLRALRFLGAEAEVEFVE